MAMEALSESPGEAKPDLRLRSYQQEMLEQSLVQNVIVAMNTGSGKTHIAISRIAEQLKYKHGYGNNNTHQKSVWFIRGWTLQG